MSTAPGKRRSRGPAPTAAVNYNSHQVIGILFTAMEDQMNVPEPVPEPAAAPKPGGLFNALSWIRDLFFSILIAIILIVFIYQPVKVEGTSMMPALTDQERIFINKFNYQFGIGSIERGDMVVFWFPLDKTKSYIKRVIGLPGDSVEIDRGQVIVNGKPLDEPYVPEDYRDRTSYSHRVVPA